MPIPTVASRVTGYKAKVNELRDKLEKTWIHVSGRECVKIFRLLVQCGIQLQTVRTVRAVESNNELQTRRMRL